MNPKYHLLVAIAALSFGACSTDDTCTGPENGAYKISFTVAEDTETRTTLDAKDVMRWVPTDEVGIYTVGKNKNPNTLTVADVNQSPVEFIGVLKKLVSPGDMFYAYYPYNAEQSDDPSSVKLSIPTEQTQTEAGVYNGKSHPLVALPMEFPWERDSKACRMSSVRFRQLGAIVELQLYSSDEALRGESISSVTFESDIPLAGDFWLNLKTVTDKVEWGIILYDSKVVTTWLEEPAAIPATKDEAARVYLTIAPGEYTGQIVVETNVAQYTFRLAEAMTFERAVIKGLPADLAEAERGEINPDASIHFIDPEVKRICVENWDTNSDGELSYKEAAVVTSIESQFQTDQKTSILSFNELRYFTGLQSIGDHAFDDCSNLTNIIIPDGVTSIGDYAFDGCSSLTNIIIPNGVTSIGNEAFSQCSSLTSINIPDGVTTIGDWAFDCCNMTSIHIPDGVTAIGEGAFESCSNLTSINIPDGVTSIGRYAFRSCSNLTSINIPDGVSSIGAAAFAFCSSLTSINIPNGVTSIGDYTFNNCSSLTSIDIPEGVAAIGEGAFQSCNSLTSIKIPNGVTTIGYRTFNYCSSLTSIDIPEGVTAIGNQAFYNCRSLTSIHLPDGVTAIGDWAFEGCSSLTSITIPEEVTTIGNSAFAGCSSLTSISIPQTISSIGGFAFGNCPSLSAFYGEYASSDQRCLILDGTLIAFARAGLNESGYTIPDGVTAIGDSAFSGCSSLTSVHIPDGVTSIGERAFSYCSSLTSINIPNGVTAIENGAFGGCSNLTIINLPNGVTSIGDYAFSDCSSLTSIQLPDGLTTIGYKAFAYCRNLTSINIPQTVSSISEEAIICCSSLSAFYGKYASADHRCLIQDGTLLAFAPADLTESEYMIPEGVTRIGNTVFSGCSSLTSITIPEGVTSIGDYAFERCDNLTSIYCKPATPPTLGGWVLNFNPSLRIYVPAASVEAYKTAGNWSVWAFQIVANNN